MAETTVTMKVLVAQEIPGEVNKNYPDSKNWFVTCLKDGHESKGWYWGSKDLTTLIGKDVEMIVNKAEPKGLAKYKISFQGGGFKGGRPFVPNAPTPDQQIRMKAWELALKYHEMISNPNWADIEKMAEKMEIKLKG